MPQEKKRRTLEQRVDVSKHTDHETPPVCKESTQFVVKRKLAEEDDNPSRRVKHKTSANREDNGQNSPGPSLTRKTETGIQREIIQELALQLGVSEWRVEGAVSLFREGATLPFVARYRKEATGTMDEEKLRRLQRGMEQLEKVSERREAIQQALSKSGKLTSNLQRSLAQATTLHQLEDLYLPFKPKRKTRASDARDQGLQPLASLLSGVPVAPFTAPHLTLHPKEAARVVLKIAKSVDSLDAALAGARDIFAEETMENPEVRAKARSILRRGLQLLSKERKKGADAQGQFEMYHSFQRAVDDVAAHSVLAIARGDKQKILSVKMQTVPSAKSALLHQLKSMVRRQSLHAAWQGEQSAAVEDGLDRLLLPSLEREWWRESVENAQAASLASFATNLRQKLLQPPVKGCAVLAIDPGYRTGCKVAIVGDAGQVGGTTVIFPDKRKEEAARQVTSMLQSHNCATIAIGNGSGSREAEALVRDRVLPSVRNARYTIVDEAGASVYSASPLAGAELPDMDVALRGAVSLARRIQDPLSELVKIDPKSIGVGMYQHDMDAKALAEELRIAVESAVNAVGVDVNTASASLLQYIAGLNARTAASILKVRSEQGPFASRQQLLKVPGIGPKTYEQAAGFLRIFGGDEVLDSTSVHPESYAAARVMPVPRQVYVKAMLKEEGIILGEGGGGKTKSSKARGSGGREIEQRIGEETRKDILEAVTHPNRDPREHLLGVPPPAFISKQDCGSGGGGRVSMGDLKAGVQVKGVVRNVVDFGVFVDIGVQRDGLLHVSQMPKSHPKLQVGSVVECWIKSVDAHKSGTARIALTLRPH